MQPGHTHAGQCLERDVAELGRGKVALPSKQTGQSVTQPINELTTDGGEIMPRGGDGRDGGHSKPGYPGQGSSVIAKKVTGRSRGFF